MSKYDFDTNTNEKRDKQGDDYFDNEFNRHGTPIVRESATPLWVMVHRRRGAMMNL